MLNNTPLSFCTFMSPSLSLCHHQGAIALCEMVEFYGCTSKLNLAHNHRLRPRAWLTIGRTLKKVQHQSSLCWDTDQLWAPYSHMYCTLFNTVSVYDNGQCELLWPGGADSDPITTFCAGQLQSADPQDGGQQPHRKGYFYSQWVLWSSYKYSSRVVQ